jgi:hypothetical protein
VSRPSAPPSEHLAVPSEQVQNPAINIAPPVDPLVAPGTQGGFEPIDNARVQPASSQHLPASSRTAPGAVPQQFSIIPGSQPPAPDTASKPNGGTAPQTLFAPLNSAEATPTGTVKTATPTPGGTRPTRDPGAGSLSAPSIQGPGGFAPLPAESRRPNDGVTPRTP